MERKTRIIENPDQFKVPDNAGKRERIITGLKNVVLRPDLGYIKLNGFQLSTLYQIDHKEDCTNAVLRVFPIWNVIASPQVGIGLAEYSRHDKKLAQCSPCGAEQVIDIPKGGEKK